MEKIEYDGLNLYVDYSNYQLYLDNKKLEYSVRKFSELNDVLMKKTNEEGIAYYMYRGVFNDNDRKIFEKYRIRFDITIMIPKLFEKEYNKTYGHYHPLLKNGYSYPELYEIISGKALFILQSRDFKQVFLIYGKEGDQVFIYPNYGHVSINISENKPLILANLVYWDFESDYSIYKQKHGAILYYTTDGFILNKNYDVNPEIQEMKAERLFDNNLYKEFLKNPNNFLYLKNAEL